MPLFYALVSRSCEVLAEHTDPAHRGNFALVTRTLLRKIPGVDGRMSYIYGDYLFHYMVSSGMTYLCISDRTSPRLAAFTLLDNLKRDFTEAYGDRARSAVAYSFNADFERTIAHHMDAANVVGESAGSEKISLIHEEIEQVKQVMIKNIELLLERGERIELLVQKTEELDLHAMQFHRSTRSLHRSFRCANLRLSIIILFFILAVLYVIGASACGGLVLPKCI